MTEDITDLFDSYIEHEFNGRFRLEGTAGVRNLEKICEDIGYREGQFIGNHYLLNFLADNPAAAEMLFEFIRDGVCSRYNTEWRESLDLESYRKEETEEETEEEDL